MDKAELLQLVARAYDDLNNLLAPLDEADMLRPGVYDNLSLKDILAHLTAWERLVIDWMGDSLCGEKPVLYTPGFVVDGANNLEVMHQLNHRIFQENRHRSLHEVLTDFRATHVHLVEMLHAMAEEDLTDPQRFDWCGGQAAWRWIADNSYEHYEEHMEQIRAWFK